MKINARPCSSLILISLLISAVPTQAALVINPGPINLQPNQGGQVIDVTIQNTDLVNPVNSLLGLNFAAQVGDGLAGPAITDVKLYAGNSVFSAYADSQKDQGSTSWLKFFGIDDGGAAVSIPANSTTVFAQLTFDTTGIGAGQGPWTLTFNNVGSTHFDSHYVLTDTTIRSINTFAAGQSAVVPEPAACGGAIALLLSGFVLVRQWRR
jgi:hypothetical protein